MRASCLKISFLAVLIGAFAGLTTKVSGASFLIIPTNQTWRYIVPTDNAFCLNGTGWETSGFDDSGWAGPSPGGFTGGETTAATVTSLAGWLNTSTLPAPTALLGRPYYFRTHFNLADTNGLSLAFTNRVDDQAVWYINGVRVMADAHANDPEVCAPGGDGGGEATTNFVFTLTAAQLGGIIHVGDNVLAVSVHQNATGSSDMVFGTTMSGAVASPATIDYPTSSLTNRTVAQCTGSTTLSVAAGGSPAPTYQWFKDGTAIGGATAATFAINNATPANGGSYHVVVSNASAVVTSSPDTVVTVTPDNTPPAVLYAIGNTLTTFTVVFTETIDTNTPLVDVLGNFSLTDTNTGNPVAINSAIALANSTGYIFDTDPRDPAHGYSVNILDSSIADKCAGNPAGEINAPVFTYTGTPLALSATWQYLDNDIDPGATWFQTGFNDSAWLSGAGPFDAKRDQPTAGGHCRNPMTNYFGNGTVSFPITCINLTSPVTATNLLAAYFRTHFTYAGKTNATVLELSGKFDDGAIVYLNGVELVRVALPAGTVTKNTVPTRTVGDTEGRDIEFFASTPLLHNGDNVIAIELNQQSLTSSDLTMGLEINAFSSSVIPGPVTGPTLHIVPSGHNVIISWTGGGTLQGTDNMTTPPSAIVWANVAGTSPVTIAASAAKKFYRVTVP